MSDSDFSSLNGLQSPTFGTATFTTLSATETRSVTPSRLSPSPVRSYTPSTTQETYTLEYDSSTTPQATTRNDESNLDVTFAQLNAEIGSAMRSWAVPRSAQEVPPRNTLASEDYWQTDYPNPRLSTITERTENLASRPTSFAQTNLSTRDLDHEVPAPQPQASSHFRASTDVPQATRSPLFGPRSPAGRHVGQKVAYWEHRLGATSPSAHSRSASEPSGFSTQSTLTTFSGTCSLLYSVL
ncbi:hypothetical protein QCA50_004913 [Cerrena zonata]|uniref:Uncharacterized protein n=1 Tax=Cerrena zonata TaxID=2478898 RepID=A0AAW0GI89_9APHY